MGIFGPKIKISDTLIEKVKEACELTGSVTPDEFVERAVQKEVDRVFSQAPQREISKSEVDDIAAKMKGLGYLE